MGQCWQHQALMSVAVGDKYDKGSIMVTTGDVCRGHWLGCMLVAVLWMAPAIFSTGTSGCGRQSSRWWSEWPCWALEVTCPASAPVPVRSRPSSDPAQFSHWLHRAMMSLHILLALSCVVLLALVLMKNSELSQELLVLKREIWNVSISVQECQKEQKAGWSTIKERINSNKELIETVKNKVQEGNLKLRTLPTDLTNIKNELRKITEMLKTPSPKPTTK
uniref:Mast cell expressed membrane protein 1 n=1 Tax=Sus scrofa TaxID=9823 RepID=A0A8D1WJP0_PIG